MAIDENQLKFNKIRLKLIYFENLTEIQLKSSKSHGNLVKIDLKSNRYRESI